MFFRRGGWMLDAHRWSGENHGLIFIRIFLVWRLGVTCSWRRGNKRKSHPPDPQVGCDAVRSLTRTISLHCSRSAGHLRMLTRPIAWARGTGKKNRSAARAAAAGAAAGSRRRSSSSSAQWRPRARGVRLNSHLLPAVIGNRVQYDAHDKEFPE